MIADKMGILPLKFKKVDNVSIFDPPNLTMVIVIMIHDNVKKMDFTITLPQASTKILSSALATGSFE